nr:hypothetical protein [uncultured Methylophaga sp.]
MTLGKKLIPLLFTALSMNAAAYQSKDEQIDAVLNVVQTGSQERKETVLERLQWSGISDPRLYDVLEADLLANYQEKLYDSDKRNLMAYEVRALGYSGNPKYTSTLELLAKKAAESKVKRHAKKALSDLSTYISVQRQLSHVVIEQPEKPFEVQMYMRMIQTGDSYTQRLAARASFHENIHDPELMALFTDQLESMYMNPDLDALGQDTAAWICKVLKQDSGHEALLAEVAEKTPHRKIQKYAK